MRRLVLFACIVAQLIGKTEYQINQIFTQMMSPNNSHNVERNNKIFKIHGKYQIVEHSVNIIPLREKINFAFHIISKHQHCKIFSNA